MANDREKPLDILRQENHEMSEKIAILESRNQQLMEELRLARHKIFGRSSEKTDLSDLPLFDELNEQPAVEEPVEDDTITVAAHTKSKPGRKPIDPNLERVPILHDIPEADKHCACGHDMVKIGEEISERLQSIREQFWVEQHIRPYYGCKHCEGSGDEDKPAIRIADPPPSIIPKSIVTSGLLAMIETNKFCDHLPFYRQEAHFANMGIDISRQDMSNWHLQVAAKVQPIIDLMEKHLSSCNFMQMDETPLQVLNEPARPDTSKSYMWLARGGPPDKHVILYRYRETRGASHIKEMLKGFKGYLQTDGYKAYDSVLAGANIIHVGCMAHARREFDEASKASKNAQGAQVALGYFARIYAVERNMRELLAQGKLTPDEFTTRRRNQVSPILEKFHDWLTTQATRIVPSSYLGKAISYTVGQWDKLIRYLDLPEITPDNNAAERAIRPFVLGRKNWLFAGSPEGAHASCAMYSLIETAKANGLNPYNYLLFLFEKLPLVKKQTDYADLLPFKIKGAQAPISIPIPKYHSL